MKTSEYLTLIRIILLSFISFSNSTNVLSPIHGAFIHDLFGETTEFTSYVSQWTLSGRADPNLPEAFVCSAWTNLGRPGLLNDGGYFERTYSSLISHTFLFFKMSVFVMDNWSSSDYYEILFDNRPFFQGYPSNKRSLSTTNLCGNAAEKDLTDIAFGRISHSSQSLTVKIVAHLDNAPVNAWLAITNVVILLTNNTAYGEDKCSGGNTGVDECRCGLRYYYDPFNATAPCQPCHSSCVNCFGPTDLQCFVCFPPKSFDGVRCKSPIEPNCYFSDFLNNKCDMCTFPAALSWNHTCLATCSAPYILETIGGHNYCKTPCQDNNTYLTWNNQCDSCNWPLVQRVEGNGKFCDHPCADNQYLYSNGSCLSNCNFFPRTVGVKNFCDSCPGGSFLYPNGTCISSCAPPRISKIEGGYNYCLSLCMSNMEYYSKNEAKCVPICGYPNKVEDELFCVLNLSKEEVEALGTFSTVMKSASHVRNITAILVRLVSFTNPAAALFGSLGDLIMYIKYLRINYPPKLQYLLDQPQSEGILQEMLAIPSVIEDCFTKRELPEQFQKYDITSSFFVNIWQVYLNLLIVGGAIIVTCLLKLCLKRFSYFNTILTGINQALKWNFFISCCIGSFGDIAFNTYMELSTIVFDSFSSVFSFLSSIMTNILGFGLVLKMIAINIDIVNSKAQNQGHKIPKRPSNTKNKWKEYKIVFSSFKHDSLVKQAFLSIFMVRLYVFNIIVTSLFEHPLIQIIILTLISMSILIYEIMIRPFKETQNFIENLVQESALMLVNICVLILASFDAAEYEAEDAREILGYIILGVNTTFSIVGSLYFNIQLVLSIKRIYCNFMRKRNLKKLADSNKVNRLDEEIFKEDNHFDINSSSQNILSTSTKFPSSSVSKELNMDSKVLKSDGLTVPIDKTLKFIDEAAHITNTRIQSRFKNGRKRNLPFNNLKMPDRAFNPS